MPRKSKTPDTSAPEVVETAAPEISNAEPSQAQVETGFAGTQTSENAGAGAYASVPPRFESFEEFYPYYLSEHSHPDNRRLHVVGTGLAIVCLTQVVMWGVFGGFWSLVWAAIFGYGFAWAGHYFIEKNKPATFTYPLWSLMGDLKMFFEVVTRKRAW